MLILLFLFLHEIEQLDFITKIKAKKKEVNLKTKIKSRISNKRNKRHEIGI